MNKPQRDYKQSNRRISRAVAEQWAVDTDWRVRCHSKSENEQAARSPEASQMKGEGRKEKDDDGSKQLDEGRRGSEVGKEGEL